VAGSDPPLADAAPDCVAPSWSVPVVANELSAVRVDLRAWHESSWVGPVLIFAATFGFWAASFVIGLWTGSLLVRGMMALPLTLASGQLFTLAHDAGHNSYSTSGKVNAVVGRLALLPSVQVFGLWRVHHDLHHRYTNLRGRDFVWAPLTVAEYRALAGWRRLLHRIYRHPSGLGLGLYYAIELWAPRMLWPRGQVGSGQRGWLRADAVLLYGLVFGLAVSAWGFVEWIDPGRAGSGWFWASAVGLLFVAPLLGTQWLIGSVIYFNHTHPDIVWYDDQVEWAQHWVQLEASAGQRASGWRHLLLPRRIMNHTAHHLDPGIPLRRLKGAQRYLVKRFGDRIVTYRWSTSQFRGVLAQCKLYDYDSKHWTTYAEAEATA